MRQEKQLLLNEVKDQIDHFGSFVIMRYLKLSANKANDFRRQVAKIGGNVEVMRKRILIKAAKAAGVELDLEALPGHIGLVYAGAEPIEMTKLVFKFSSENAKSIEVVGGRFEGQLYNAVDVERLSKLPGKNEMRAQLLSTFEAPMAQTLAVMDALLSSVVYCLDNKCKLTQEESDQ
ncbi:MAG: 50S ribosomal protein L10 [Parachlamydiaceae bacterium]|nr:50S ribosomal protein L10 [Parachlamydiaceae bacterium]